MDNKLHTVLSPIFPPEKDIDVPLNSTPISHSNSIQIFIKLVEPVIFLQGFESSSSSSSSSSTAPPSILRGSLIIRILKPTKLKSINLNFKGFSRTEWPEGIPPKRHEFVEINDIINHIWPFYKHNNHSKFINNNDNDNNNNNIPYLLKNSGASIYKPLPKDLLTNNTSEFTLSPISSNVTTTTIPTTATNTNTTTNTTAPTPRQSRKRTPSYYSTSSPIRSLSPLTLFKRNNNTTTNNNNNNNNNPDPSIFSDLFGFSTENNITSQTNNINILTSTNHSTTTISRSNSTLSKHDTTSRDTINNNNTPDDDHFILSSTPHDTFIFEPGDYIYTFEQVISSNFPESIKAEYGFVEYSLLATIERFGAFKGDLIARLPITIIRTPSDMSVEESEPIVISRDWEKYLYYDILIASKDIILDAFLPIHFNFAPLDKVTLHRIRVYVTETMEYYCKDKKVHRLEPTKKFLLAEFCGPKLPNAPNENINNNKPLKAKYMGNLLEEDGFLINKDFELQVFVPSRFGNHQQLHPDTGFTNIKSSHWIKICLRLSKMIDNKRKHYEISIDSPIHVLNKLCSHANILLPSYDSHLLANNNNNNIIPSSTSSSSSIFHNSNIFFPKEILMSPLLSPEVKPLDINLNSPPLSPLPRSVKSMVVNNNNINNNNNALTNTTSQRTANSTNTQIFTSPKLRSNIYQPESLQRELASPQAIPLSPMTSPTISLRPRSLLAIGDDRISLNSSNVIEDQLLSSPLSPPPPSFDTVFHKNVRKASSPASSAEIPINPPSYTEVLKFDGIERNKLINPQLRNKNLSQRIPRILLNKSQDSLLSKQETEANIDFELENSNLENNNNEEEEEEEEDADADVSDIASGFSFQGSLSQSFGLNNNSMISRNKPLDSPRFTRRGSIQDNLPSTIRTDNAMFGDLSQILSDTSEDGTKGTLSASPQSIPLHQSPQSIQDISNVLESNSDNLKPSTSMHSSRGNASARSSFDASAFSLPGNASTMEPLLHPDRSGHMTNKSINDSFLQSLDTIDDFIEEPVVDSSVDITALFDRNSVGWLPLQLTNNLHSDTPIHLHKPGSGGNETRESSSPTESMSPTDERASSRISRTNENNEPKHVLDSGDNDTHIPHTIDETLG